MHPSQSLWIILAAALFAVMGICVKYADSYTSTFELVFYRSLIVCIIIASIAACQRNSLRTMAFRVHCCRGIVGFCSLSLFFYALPRLNVSTAQALLQSSPLFFTLFCVVLLRERLHKRLIVALAVSGVGMFLVLRPGFSSVDLTAGAAAIIAGVGAGLAYYYVRRLGTLNEGGIRTVFYFSGLSTVLAVLLLPFWGEIKPMSSEKAGWILMVGLTATGGQMALTRAIHYGQTSLSATLMYCSVIFSGIGEYWLWRTIPDALAWLGIGLIVVASIFQYQYKASHPYPTS